MKSMKRILSFVIMLALIVGMVPMSAVTARAARAASSDAETDDAVSDRAETDETKTIPTIVCDEEKVLNTDTDGGVGLFSFVPEEDGVYRFFSYDNGVWNEGFILDEDMHVLTDADISHGIGFALCYKMTAGKQYYLESRPRWNDFTGSYSVKVEQVPTIVCDEEKKVNTDIDEEGVGLFSFVPEEDGMYSFFSYDNDSYSYFDDMHTNGSIFGEGGWRLAEDDRHSGGNGNFMVAGFMMSGCEYLLESEPSEATDRGSYSVKVIQNSEISKLEITALPDCMDYYAGLEEFDYRGLKLKATLENGNTVSAGYDRWDGIKILGYDVEISNIYSDGEYLETRITCEGKTASFKFNVVENPVDYLELVSGTSEEAIEGYGYTNSDGQFVYYTDTPYDAVIKIVYKDGTSVTANVGDYVKGYKVQWDDNQEEHPWSVGTENPSTISYMGHTVNLPITVKETPVDHLELVSGTSKYYIENQGGYTNWDGQFIYYTGYAGYAYTPCDAVIRIVYKDGTSVTANVGDYVKGYKVQWDDNQEEHPWSVGTENPSTVSYMGRTVNLPITVKENPVESIEVVSGKITCIENDEWWYYRYQECCLPDIVVKINYINGTSKTVHVDSYYDTVVDGYAFEWSDDQDEVQWTLGDSNYLTLSYFGNTTQVPVSVIANPVDHIVINSAPTREYVLGDGKYYTITQQMFRWFTPADLTGLSFTVHYTDGSSKTFTDIDIDNRYDSGGYIDGFGYKISSFVNGYPFECGNISVTFEYMGKSADYTVVLKESPVASIAVTKNSVDYPYDFIGKEFTITYTDGTTKVVTLSADNFLGLEIGNQGNVIEQYDVDGYTLSINHGEIQEWAWAHYCECFCDIDGITAVVGKEVIRSIELDNVSGNGDGMIVNITYVDDTSETLVLDNPCVYDEYSLNAIGIQHVAYWGRTANGLLRYNIITYTDEDGHIEKYVVDILGETITVTPEPAIPGDADGDGKVSSKDVTLLQRYLVGGWGWMVDDAAADVNADGVVNSKDVTLLRRYLVGGWDVKLK